MEEGTPFHRSLRFGLLLTGLFCICHLYRLTYDGFWIDEFHTLNAISGTFRELIANRIGAGHIPTYFMLLQAWAHMAGVSEWALRFPSVLFAALAFFSFFLLTREFLLNSRAYLIALAIFFFHPFLLWASHDARPYAPLTAASVLAAHQLLVFVKSGKKRFLASYGLACIMGMSIHMIFLLQMAAHIAFTAFHHRSRLKAYLIAIVLPLAALGPLVWLTASRAKVYEPHMRLKFPVLSLMFRKPSVLVSTDFSSYLTTDSKLVENVLRGISLAFFLWFVVEGFRRLRAARNRTADSREDDLLRFAFYWIGVPAFFLMMSQIFNNPKVEAARYHLPSVGAAVVLAALGLVEAGRSRWGRIAGWAYYAFFACALFLQLAWPGPGIREAVQSMRPQCQEGDGIVYCHSESLGRAFPLYGCGQLPLLPVDRAELDAGKVLAQVQAFAKGKKRLWIFLHHAQNSPLPGLLEKHGDLFERLEDQRIRTTEVQLFRIVPSSGS